MSKYTFARIVQPEQPLFELGDHDRQNGFDTSVRELVCPRCRNATLGFNTRRQGRPLVAAPHDDDFVSIMFHCHGCQTNANLEISDSGNITLRWHEARS